MLALVLLTTVVTAPAGATAGVTARQATSRPAVAVPLSPCVESDHGNPVITSLAVWPQTVDVRTRPARIHVSATATDTGGPGPARGVASVSVRFADLPLVTSGATPPGEADRVALVQQPDGSWLGSALVGLGGRAGRYPMTEAQVSDGYSEVSYSQDKVQPNPLRTTATEVWLRSRPDTKAPKLVSLSVRPTRLDVRRGAARVHVTARARDAGTGVVAVEVGGSELRPARPVARTRTGTGIRGISTWRGVIRIPRWTNNEAVGEWPLTAYVTDGASHQVSYWGGEPRDARRFPLVLHVTARVDHETPRVEVVKPPAPIDVGSGPATAVMLLHAVDRGAGVRLFSWGYETSDPSAYVGRLVSGTRRDGIWRIAVRFDRCLSGESYWDTDMSVEDAVWHTLHFRVPDVQIRNALDVRPPEALVRPPVAAAGPITLVFNEDVTGLTAESAPVRRVAEDVPVPGPALPGSWACLTANGAAADCAGQVWRSASWTPAVPLAPGTYQVEVNPEHVLSLTDLAGNPVWFPVGFVVGG